MFSLVEHYYARWRLFREHNKKNNPGTVGFLIKFMFRVFICASGRSSSSSSSSSSKGSYINVYDAFIWDQFTRHRLWANMKENMPPGLWSLGRIMTLHAGTDGHPRVATIRTKNTEIKRAIAKLCPLPLNDNWIFSMSMIFLSFPYLLLIFNCFK